MAFRGAPLDNAILRPLFSTPLAFLVGLGGSPRFWNLVQNAFLFVN